MEKLFLVKLLSAFLVGGFATALVTFLAENSSKKISAIFIGIPTTPVVGFFFMGIMLSPQQVASVIPITPVSLGLALVFSTIYIYLARVKLNFFADTKKNKLASVFLCSIVSLAVWFSLAIPLAVYEFDTLWLSLLLYTLAVMGSYYMLAVLPHHIEAKEQKIHYTMGQKIGRFLLVGTVLSLVVVAIELLGEFWGAILTFLPAKYLSAIIILHWYYDEDFLLKTFQNISLGTTSAVTYLLTLQWTYPSFGVIWGTLCSLVISTIYVLLLMALLSGRFSKSKDSSKS